MKQVMKEVAIRIVWCLLALVTLSSFGSAQSFTFEVKHEHLRGHCAGKLIVNEEGIEYATENSKDARKWPYPDLKRIEIAARKELVLHTYEDVKYRWGAEKKFEFKLQDGEISHAVYEFLLSKATRPLITRVPYVAAAAFAFTLPAKHRHVRGGCQGELKVGDERIVYETSDPDDARIWLYKDVVSIGLMDPYSFRVTTLLETYTFDLKSPMGPEQYEFLWAKVYRLEEPHLEK